MDAISLFPDVLSDLRIWNLGPRAAGIDSPREINGLGNAFERWEMLSLLSYRGIDDGLDYGSSVLSVSFGVDVSIVQKVSEFCRVEKKL